MKTQWDYTALADAYLERPDYAPEALAELFSIAGISKGAHVCDIGAGVGHLAIPLAEAGFLVDAVDPNDAMRANGIKRTANLRGISWSEGTGEATGRPSGEYDYVSFGSSFNVCDREKALQETHRLLKPGRWFCCLWNHRNLDDPVQAAIEGIIQAVVPEYDYGTRREDQSGVIEASGLFVDVRYVEGSVSHTQTVDKIVEAWRSHATLQRQAQDKFAAVVAGIEDYLRTLSKDGVVIPYTTRAWTAKRKD